jgi:hypothetical protein
MDAKLELKLSLEGVMQAALQGCKIIHGLMSEHIKAHTLKTAEPLRSDLI